MRRDVRALARCCHPNVVEFFGVCLGSRPTVVMAFAAGGTLRDRVVAALPIEDAVALLTGIARGMSAVHASNIIHLDLKPENVLIADEGGLVPWVTDFGLAASAHVASLSNSAAGRGTLKYKAPELFKGRRQGGALLSPAADVYSFGILAWEVLAGAVPWKDMMETEIMGRSRVTPRLPDGGIGAHEQPRRCRAGRAVLGPDPDARPRSRPS